MATKKGADSWDNPENEAKNNFVGFNEVGDKVMGTLVERKQVESTLPDRAGEMQWVYGVKVKECVYHVLDDKKRVVEEAVEPAVGEIVSVGGRKVIDSRMARVKLGQVFGLKFVEELPAKTKGYNPTKLIKVYVPTDAKGQPLMDEEWIAEHQAEVDAQKGFDAM